MSNKLSPLHSALFADIKRAVAELPSQMPEVDLRDASNLLEREEHILVGPVGSGKTTLLKQCGLSANPPTPVTITDAPYIGVFDDNDPDMPDIDVVRTVTGMLKFARTQKQFAPKYKPLALIESLRWDRIQGYFNYVDPARIGHWSFPKWAFMDALVSIGDPVLQGYLGEAWLETACDARDHFMPELAWNAVLGIANQTSFTHAKPRSISEAAYEWVRSQPRLKPFLQHMPMIAPEDSKQSNIGAALQISKVRVEERLRHAVRSAPLPEPYGSKPAWMRAAEVAGIWKLRPQGWYLFGRPYGAAYTLCKQRKLLDT